MEIKSKTAQSVSYKAYLMVWAGLIILLGLTLYVAGINLGAAGIIVNILIASLKAGLVVYIFMHMKYESIYLKLMLLMTIMTLTLIIALTFLDILYR